MYMIFKYTLSTVHSSTPNNTQAKNYTVFVYHKEIVQNAVRIYSKSTKLYPVEAGSVKMVGGRARLGNKPKQQKLVSISYPHMDHQPYIEFEKRSLRYTILLTHCCQAEKKNKNTTSNRLFTAIPVSQICTFTLYSSCTKGKI